MNTPTMLERVEEYLAYRHALGYQVRIEGQRHRRLPMTTPFHGLI
jgi:hypothetical protein